MSSCFLQLVSLPPVSRWSQVLSVDLRTPSVCRAGFHSWFRCISCPSPLVVRHRHHDNHIVRIHIEVLVSSVQCSHTCHQFLTFSLVSSSVSNIKPQNLSVVLPRSVQLQYWHLLVRVRTDLHVACLGISTFGSLALALAVPAVSLSTISWNRAQHSGDCTFAHA